MRTSPQIFHDRGDPWYDAIRRDDPDIDRYTKAGFNSERDNLAKTSAFTGKRKSGVGAAKPKALASPQGRIRAAQERLLKAVAAAKGEHGRTATDSTFTMRKTRCGECSSFIEETSKCRKLEAIQVGRTTLSCRIFSEKKG